ncbi:acylglycerol kinase, mitochondrial [Diaphorina citri]|uniref:Acylglycerol kinase, mitochondrial n=1 Tax=Diaphorina citri TaxID=121845 RepID=A0A1S4EF99_DIACI|nr:acylglycerol kinase, mitochondrial [Diaphorina citri]
MVLKIFSTLRNNWKKTAFGGVVLAFGTNYVLNQMECNKLMTAHCQRALQYGDQPIGATTPLRRIIVILNPAADKRNAKKYFEKYCAPILHLSGALVDIKVTKGEGDARKLVESLKERVDAIVIAGGDGTISESSEMNALCVQVLKEGESTEESAKFYALHSIDWGNLKYAQSKRDKYWYLGPLKPYATYVFNGFSLPPVKAEIAYSNPCSGCKRCYTKRSDVKVEPKKQWFQLFAPKSTGDVKPKNYALIENDQCGVLNQQQVTSMDVKVTALPPPHMTFVKGKDSYDYQDFVKSGWDFEQFNRIEAKEQIHAQQLDIIPKFHEEDPGKDKHNFVYIDNEQFDLKPLRITLLQNTIQVYNPV